MKWRDYLLLFVLGLVISAVIASLQDLPGYLDSDYYFVGGLQLVEGRGFTEPYLWNYLDDPAGLPHPSHTYWYPLSSILAAISMYLTGQQIYAGARLIFIFIAASIPPLTSALAFDMTGRRALALTSGLLAAFSVYYLPFLPVTDNYGPYMLFGGAIFLIIKKEGWWPFLLMGLLAGLMNLARSDGLMWLALVGLVALWRSVEASRSFIEKAKTFLLFGSMVVIGYSIVMGPWYARNYNTFGSIMPPGGGRVLWLTNYNDTFAFPAERVNLKTWLEAGWGEALKARSRALGMNLLNAFAAQGGILLFPFILIGFWQYREDIRARIAASGWIILLVVMTLVFPFAGARGSFFHAGASFQPFWWALAPVGLNRLVDFLYKKKILTAAHAGRVFQGFLVIICVLLSIVIVQVRILVPGWQPEEKLYLKVEQTLIAHGARPVEIAIVRNPAGYYIVSRRPTIVMPPGGPQVILALAERYGASYFILEPGGILEEYRQLYQQYDGYSGFEYIGEVDGARIYAIHIAE